jgi:phenylacetate-coenzyme A ligase PaaK-like adenylate-forming protein
MQRIEDPQGRLDDIFVYDDGLTVHPHLFRSALADHPEILEYQVRQTRDGVTIVLVAAAVVDVETLRTSITAGARRARSHRASG